jgi:hypothetical protein
VSIRWQGGEDTIGDKLVQTLVAWVSGAGWRPIACACGQSED